MKYLQIVVIATRCENNAKKITVLILVLLTNFLFCHPYVTMPNVSLNLV